MEGRKNQVLLVDAYGSIYRSFHAIRGLSNPAGAPVNALYGMARLALKLDRDFPSKYTALVLDKGKCERRIGLLPEYKANRPPMPDELRSQVPLIRDWFEAMGWPLLWQEGWEADDLIAVAAEQSGELPVYIVSHDKDLAQLVRDGVVLVQSAGQGAWRQLGPADVEEKFGIPPERVVDFLALVGDSSDNIPGVKGVGPKTAASLLREHGTLDTILEHPEQVSKPGLRDTLTAAREELLRNRELVRLKTTDCEQWHGLDAIERRRPDWSRLIEIAREQGFKSLIGALQKERDEARSPRLL